ncbi:putative uncharacterized protein DDB_G0282133 [Oppia nitens]|uniref:putative uncharacterized protein DDB_G0282133 n=1 Tax=Oppia nitens TaxID=1686743 RepID=UPI0023D98922|nr:putative uncharacterized protein DDB_G0282133 [Oppia nitens]
MGNNNVTTTPVETIKIDDNNEDNSDNTNNKNIHYNKNKINGLSYDINSEFEQQNEYLDNYPNDEPFNQNWNPIDPQSVDKVNAEHITGQGLSINETIEHLKQSQDNNIQQNHVVVDKTVKIDNENIFDDFAHEDDLIESTSSQVISPKVEPIKIINTIVSSGGLQKDINIVKSDIIDIDDLQSIESGSKLTLNETKSDSEDVLQELNKLSLDLEDKEDKNVNNYRKLSRKRGQSWSNWDNTIHDDLKAESSLSSFSRPNSNNEIQTLKTKSYTAPEARGQNDSAIEWLAKQHGLDTGVLDSTGSHKRIINTESRISQNTFRLSSMDIPGSVSLSSPSTPGKSDHQLNHKYDDLDQQLINSIENDFIK